MPSETCPICYNLDSVKLHKLTANRWAFNQVARHWIKSKHLRGEVPFAGVDQSKHRCETCALLRDAVETFLREDAFGEACPDPMEYSVAVVRSSFPDDDADGESDRESQVTWQSVDEDGPDFSPDETSGVGDKGLLSLRLAVRASIGEAKDRVEPWNEEFELEVYSQSGSPPRRLRYIGAAGEVLVAPTPDDYAARIKQWLQQCVDTHRTCHPLDPVSKGPPKRIKPRPLPKRVLDVTNDKIVLVETNHKEDFYVTLTHRWGVEHTFVTTNHNLAERMGDIPLSTLPQNFQDAVLVTRALGVRYLWIDALCVIQHDDKDREEHFVAAADIFAGCYLNIATTRSSKPSEGFLGPRFTSQNTWVWMPDVAIQGDESAPKIRRREVMSYTVVNNDHPDQYHGDLRVRLPLDSCHHTLQTPHWVSQHQVPGPLSQRAWIYQERNLAPRTVYFHETEMLWECAESQRCECRVMDMKTLDADYFGASKARILGLQPSEAASFWRAIVEEYCLMNLTSETDRLPALAGLATRFAQVRPGRDYLAGLWKDTLGRDLLWQVDGEKGGKRRGFLGQKTPPSWSWASIAYGDGQHGIRWEYETKPKLTRYTQTVTYKQDGLFSVLKASCTPTVSSPFSNISAGSITVTGAMCAIAVTDNTAPIPKLWEAQIPIRSHAAYNSLHLHYDDADDQAYVTSERNPVRGLIFCLFVGTFFSEYELDPKTKHPNHTGLILRPSVRVPGAAERIGLWNQFVESWVEGKRLFTKEAAKVTVRIV